MSDKQTADRMVFEVAKHHKQILRSQIDGKMIDQIEINQNPSQNYMNAYKNMYNDELSKTVERQELKKQKQRTVEDEDRNMYRMGMVEQRPAMTDATNMTTSQLSKYGQRYVDYDQERTYKFENHIKKNYDGGQGFFKAHDQHLQRKEAEATNTNQTINGQLQFNQQKRQDNYHKKQEEIQAFN